MLKTTIDTEAVKHEIATLLDLLSIADLQRALQYIQELPKRPEGMTSQDLLHFGQEHPLSVEEGAHMQEILQELGLL
jgi:hypothetical protein